MHLWFTEFRIPFQQWYDYKLTWTPQEYGGVERLYVPSDEIWLPDIVLYNRWEGEKLYNDVTITSLHLKLQADRLFVQCRIISPFWWMGCHWVMWFFDVSVVSPHKWPVVWKVFPCHVVIVWRAMGCLKIFTLFELRHMVIERLLLTTIC